MKVRKTLFSRKGVAVEYAIMIMVVIMGLSTIILTNSMMQASYRTRLEKEFFAQLDADSIGMEFVYDCTNNTDWESWKTECYAKYTNIGTITVTCDTQPYRELLVVKNEQKVLYVKVKQFSYLAPTIEIWESYE